MFRLYDTSVSTHKAQYAHSSDRKCMRTLPPHTAPTRAVCVGMVHMIYSGSSKGTHTAPYEIFNLTY